jgi:hypothetical protein
MAELDPNFKLWPENDVKCQTIWINDPNFTRKKSFGLMQMIFYNLINIFETWLFTNGGSDTHIFPNFCTGGPKKAQIWD